MNFVKNIFLTLAVALTSLVAVAQPQLLEPVTWSTSVEQIAETHESRVFMCLK